VARQERGSPAEVPQASSSASLSSFDNSDSSDDSWDEWVANNCDAIQQAERHIHEHQAMMEAIRNHTL
jgi:hypothetical protein